MGRYDLNDRSHYDGRPTQKTALSPRNPLRAGNPKPEPAPPSGSPTAPKSSTRYRKPRRRRDTNMRGYSPTYYRPRAEDYAGTLPNSYCTAPTPTRVNSVHADPDRGTHGKQLAAAQHEGYRRRAMQDHSLSIRTGEEL